MLRLPNIERALQHLEEALNDLPVPSLQSAPPELRREYIRLMMYLVHTKDRRALLHGCWSAAGAPHARDPKPLSRSSALPPSIEIS